MFFDEMIRASALDEMIEIFPKDIVYLPVNRTIFFEYKTGRITKRGIEWLCGLLCHCANQELFFCERVNSERIYHQAFLKKRPMFLKKNAIPNAPATMAWTR